ncbi:MAG: ROK family glucokinase [Lachnospiraceae bacterium]|nr:ROK family glucokinase [Lachnospiraceae bacterium]
MKKYAFGVDIGGTTVKIGLFKTNGELMDTWEIKTRTEDGGANILPDIAEAINAKLAEKGIAIGEVEGIGMGVPGPVDDEGCVLGCVNLGWGVFNAAKEMKALTGLTTEVGNDANVAALGEMWMGGGKGHSSIVMVTLGTGVGGGVILNGKIVPGTNGAAGEIGHMTMVDDETEVCGCGKCGCLEQYTSANGVARVAKKYVEEHAEIATKLREVENITSKEVFDFAREGDEVALHIVDETGKMLGKALAYISCVMDPESFVIGGGMSKAGDILIDAIKKHFVKYAFHASRDTEFKVATLGNLAGIYGSVKMVL